MAGPIKKRNGSALPPSPLADLVAQALKLEPEWKKLDTLPGRKLGPEAFFRESLKAAGSTPERVKKLLETLRSDRGSLENARGSFRRMKLAVKSPNWTSPPREFRRLNFLLDKEGKTVAELAAIGSNTIELFAAAALIAAEETPEAFGEAESTAAIETRVGELARQRDEIFARIPREVAASDLHFSDFDKEGRARISLTMTNGAVVLHPMETLGERLVNWALAQERTPA